MTRLTELVRAAHFRKRQDAIDHRCELPGIDNPCDLRQLCAIRLRSKLCSPDAEFFGFVLRRQLD